MQLSFFLGLNALILSEVFLYVAPLRLSLPLPVLISINSPSSTTAGALDVMQVMFGKGEFPWVALGIVFVIGAIFGRFFCGWVCPMGFVQELITDARGKKIDVPPRTHKPVKSLKFMVLAGTLLISCSLALSLYLGVGEDYKNALGTFAQGPFMIISPDGTLFGTVPWLIRRMQQIFLGPAPVNVTTEMIYGWFLSVSAQLAIKLILLGALLIGAYSIPWFWCRYLCPVGALMGIFSRLSLLGMSRNPLKCEKCPYCEKKCPMQIRILDLPWQKFNDQECILCMECVDACPHGALRPKFA
jgi:polyferredoxin